MNNLENGIILALLIVIACLGAGSMWLMGKNDKLTNELASVTDVKKDFCK